MKKTALAIATTLLIIGAKAENLRITFGAEKDLAASTGTPVQNKDAATPRITVQGMEGGSKLEIEFSVAATGGKLARLGMGYRLDEGYALTFKITSAIATLADGKSHAVDGCFISVSGNNKGANFTTDNQHDVITWILIK